MLHRRDHELDAGDVNTPSRSEIDQSGELLGENPIRMWWVSHIFDVACTWLKGLLKNDEEPPVLEERWSFQRCRGMDEAERSICGLESSVPTTDVGLASEQAQACVETPLNSHIANRSPFNCDMGSLRGEIKCLDAQRTREADFFEFKVLSDM